MNASKLSRPLVLLEKPRKLTNLSGCESAETHQGSNVLRVDFGRIVRRDDILAPAFGVAAAILLPPVSFSASVSPTISVAASTSVNVVVVFVVVATTPTIARSGGR